MKIKSILTIIVILLSLNTNAQDEALLMENLNYDYFNHNYKYLDNFFRINISNNEFRNLMTEYKFIPERIKTYKDSLSVVFMGEFHDWEKTRIAQNRIGFSWLRAGYYLWLSKNEAKLLGEKYGFKHPYYLYQYFWTDDESKWDEDMKHFMFELRKKVDKVDPNTDVMILKNNKFLMKALLLSPDRIRDYQKLTGQSDSSEGCGKTDCCQTKEDSTNEYKVICDSLSARRYKHFLDVDFKKILSDTSISDKEKRVYAQVFFTAFKRVNENIVIENGLYKITVVNGQAIGISENLFDIFKFTFDVSNQQIIKMQEKNPDLKAQKGEFMKNKYWIWNNALKYYTYYEEHSNK